MPRRLVTAVLVPVALAVTVSGCSSSKSSTASPAAGKTSAAAKASASASASSGTSLLQSAYAKTSAAKSARVAVTIRSSAGGLASLNSDITGVVDFANHSAQLTTKLPGIGSTEVRMIGGTSYIHLPASLTSKLKTLKPWLRSTSSSSAGGDPTQVLGFLRAAGSMSKVGSDTVRGATATHYKGTVNAAKLAAVSGSASSAAAVKKLYGSTNVPVDIWVDDAGRAVRVRATIPAPKIGATPGSGATKGTITTSSDYYDFGVPVHVVAPPASQVGTSNLPGATG